MTDIDGNLGVKTQVLGVYFHPQDTAARLYCSLFELIEEAIPAGIQRRDYSRGPGW